jgi:hypothetical protein
MIEWFKKQKHIFSDWSTLLTFFAIGLFTVVNIIVSFVPDFNKYFIDNNIYMASGWSVIFLILINIHKVLEYISKIGTCYSYQCNDISEIIYKFKNYNKVRIFFGLETFHIWEKISKKVDLNFNNLEIYFDPMIIKDYKSPLFKVKNLEVCFTDLPRNYIYISGYSNSCELCNLIVEEDNSLSVIDLSKEHKNKFIFDNLFKRITEENKISLNDKLKTKALYFLIDKSKKANKELIKEQNISLSNREEFLQIATILVENAEKSLYAIDFIGPQYWTNKKDSAYKFGDAHKIKISGSKKRIHIYNFDTFDKKHPDLNSLNLYIEYINFMEERKVELQFLPEKDFDKEKYEKRGSLIIDNKSVIIAINPEDGARFGEVSFKEKDLISYKSRFDDIDEMAISSEEFKIILEKRYKK